MKSYPLYRDAGLEWIARLPMHWHQRRVGYLFSERREKVSDKDFTPLSVTMGGIVPQIETAAKTDDGDNRKLVRVGDFVINSRSDRKGSSGLSERDGSVSLISTVLVPGSEIAGAYAHHLLRSEVFQEEYYRNGQGIVADLWSTPYSRMRDIWLPLPPLSEQQRIAAFLDHETDKIDTLIGEQERLIALLREKRRAVISHGVTSGLDPTVRTKDSKIEWIGRVPETWTLRRIRDIARFSGGGTPSREVAAYWDGGIPWVSAKDMKVAFIADSEEHISPSGVEQSAAQLVEPGCVLMVVRSGILRHTIPTAINLVPVTVNQDMRVLRMKAEVCEARFFCLWVEGLNDRLLLAWSKQGATVESIEDQYLRRTIIPLPPLAEQRNIIAFLDSRLREFGGALSEQERLVAILRERRSALITAAVTGQIDVRGLVEPTAA